MGDISARIKVLLFITRAVVIRWDIEQDAMSYFHGILRDPFYGEVIWCEDLIHVLAPSVSKYPTIYNAETENGSILRIPMMS